MVEFPIEAECPAFTHKNMWDVNCAIRHMVPGEIWGSDNGCWDLDPALKSLTPAEIIQAAGRAITSPPWIECIRRTAHALDTGSDVSEHDLSATQTALEARMWLEVACRKSNNEEFVKEADRIDRLLAPLENAVLCIEYVLCWDTLHILTDRGFCHDTDRWWGILIRLYYDVPEEALYKILDAMALCATYGNPNGRDLERLVQFAINLLGRKFER
ncbi:MAG TPA: hypothetical protein VN397_00445 [Candidatus Methylomirabilis sp.]|nr:hypothetical protein [Candidatus Methylomirabilis sp.]